MGIRGRSVLSSWNGNCNSFANEGTGMGDGFKFVSYVFRRNLFYYFS